MMKLKKLFINCDLFGKTQSFTIASNSSYQTYFGALVSVVVVGVLTYLFFYFGLEVFLRKKPSVIITTYNDDDPPETLLDDSQNIMTLALQNLDYNSYINESIYTVNGTVVTMTPGENGFEFKYEPFYLMKCSEYKFKFLEDYFTSLDLNNLYCLNTSTPYKLKGDFAKPQWTYLQIHFDYCVNSTENNNSCMPEEEIKSRLSGGYIGMFISHVSVVPTNFLQPFFKHGLNVFTSFTSNQYSDIWMYMKPLIMQTDDGLIFIKNKTERIIIYDSIKPTYDYRGGNTFISLNIRLSLLREVYERRYIKVQGVAAEIGGIIKFGLVLGEIFVYFIREILYKDFLFTFFYEESPKRMMSATNISTISNCNGLGKRDTLKTNNYVLGSQRNISLTKRDFISKDNIYVVDTINNKLNHLSSSRVNPNSLQRNNTLISRASTNYLVNVNTPEQFKKKTAFPYIRQLLCFFFNEKVRTKVNKFNLKFKRISMLFDIIYYLKQRNELNLLMKKVFPEKSNLKSIIQYQFELPSNDEKELFDCYVSLKQS